MNGWSIQYVEINLSVSVAKYRVQNSWILAGRLFTDF